MPTKDKKLQRKEIALSGKLITAEDPTKVGENFQSLINMRYREGHIQAIGGNTKINTSVMDATYLKARSAIHYTKDQPSESHVMVEAYNTGETASRVLQNTTAIPSAGDFSATSLYTPTAGASVGRWSLAPDGDLAYCNGEDTCLWGGTEREISGFVNYDPGGSFSYDYTDQVRNTLTDSANIATLNSSAGGIDSNVMLLLDLDNDVTDTSPTTPHTVTNNNVTFSTSSVFGSHAAVFTTDAYLTVPDNADFDLSGGTFSIDKHINLDDLSSDYSIYYQNTTNDDDSFNLMVDTNGAVLLRIKAGGAKQFTGATDFSTGNGVVSAGTWYHIELVHSADDWYIFVDGKLKGYTSDAAEPANYTGLVQIGYDGTTYLEGKIDEFRVSNSARHTTDFEIPTEAYSTTTTQTNIYIGAIRPIDGFKLTIGTANASTSTMTAFYWDGSAWTTVSSLTDGTASGGVSLAQTGTVTFTSTVSTANLKYINGTLIYWYRIVIDVVDANTSVTYATVSTPFQTIKDIWSGVPTPIDFFQKYEDSNYIDATLNVRESEYVSTNTGTYVELDSLTTATEYFVCGFSDKMIGVYFNLVSSKGNTTAGTVVSVEYWNGTAWTSVGSVDDGTLENSISFAKSGAVTWNGISAGSEFTTSLNNDAELYYYKFSFSKSLSADVQVYYINGIPSQKDLSRYSFPLHANDRLWLCANSKSRKNSAICTSIDTSSTFNGEDSATYFFGDDTQLTGGAWLYSQYGSSLYNVTIFFKANEMWSLVGTNPEDWVKYRISSVIGCTAPETIKVVDIGPSKDLQGLNRNIVVWQGANGVYISDGRSPILISKDIEDKFDKRLSTSINQSKISDSQAVWDADELEYHWLWASGSSTTLNEEWVFDFDKLKWFEVERGSGMALQAGVEVKDTNGATYSYGLIDTGYMERLENGTDFDGNDITCTVHTGDIAPTEGYVSIETMAEYHGLYGVAKTTTSNSITITHYGDGETSGTSWTESPQKSGYRIYFPVNHQDLGAHTFHSWKYVMVTDDETIGFELLYAFTLYSTIRDHLRDWR